MTYMNSNVFVVLEGALLISIAIYAKNVLAIPQMILVLKSIGNTHGDIADTGNTNTCIAILTTLDVEPWSDKRDLPSPLEFTLLITLYQSS